RSPLAPSETPGSSLVWIAYFRLVALLGGKRRLALILSVSARSLFSHHVVRSFHEISSLPAGASAGAPVAEPNADAGADLVLRRSARWQPGARRADECRAKAGALPRAGGLRAQGNRSRFSVRIQH